MKWRWAHYRIIDNADFTRASCMVRFIPTILISPWFGNSVWLRSCDKSRSHAIYRINSGLLGRIDINYHPLARVNSLCGNTLHRNTYFEEMENIMNAFAAECSMIARFGKRWILNDEIYRIYLRQTRKHSVKTVVVEHQFTVLPRVFSFIFGVLR